MVPLRDLGGNFDFQEFPKSCIRTLYVLNLDFQKMNFYRGKIKAFEGEGGASDCEHFFGDATGHRILRCILARRSRASSESPYIISFCIFVSFFSHPHLPNRGFPSPRASRCRFSAPKRTLPLLESHTLPHIQWIHGSAAASAKRTEIRRATPDCMELPKAFQTVPFIVSFRKRKLSIGWYTTPHVENHRFPSVKLFILM